MCIYEQLIEFEETSQQQDTFYNQQIDECTYCSFDRFTTILQQLPLDRHLSALHAAVRCMNRKVLKKYLPDHLDQVVPVLLYCCQLNYDAFVKFLAKWLTQYPEQCNITLPQKHIAVWWAFRNRNHELAAYLIIEFQLSYTQEQMDIHFTELNPVFI